MCKEPLELSVFHRVSNDQYCISSFVLSSLYQIAISAWQNTPKPSDLMKRKCTIVPKTIVSLGEAADIS
jgi:hypothetical protein